MRGGMNEQESYIRAHLLRELWHTDHRVGQLQRLLEDAVAERQRLRQHLRQLEQEEEKGEC
jgi:hypothetical protein